jgi:DNA-binding CsgD family transcriptional regulator
MPRFYLKFGIHSVPVERAVVTMGRGPSAGIRLEGHAISRLHATLLLDERGLSVRDEGSKNGVFVNGRRITALTPLTMGDTLGLATEEMVVHIDASSDASRESSETETQDYGPRDVTGTELRALGALSHRERQVFKMLAQGFGNRDIGERLGVSPKTIATYRARLTEKLGVKSRASLVEVALQMGILGGAARADHAHEAEGTEGEGTR